MKKVTESFTEARNLLIKKLLDHAPVGLMAHSRENLARYLEGQPGNGYDVLSFYAKFERSGTSCELHIEFHDSYKGRYGCDAVLDEDGNEWLTLTPKCDINYPCHGSSDPATTMARLAFYNQVALFAAEINAEFDGRYNYLNRTAQDISKVEEFRKQEALKVRVNNIVALHVSGRRWHVGKTILFTGVESIDDLNLNKTYTAVIKNQTYTVCRTDDHGSLNITRIA